MKCNFNQFSTYFFFFLLQVLPNDKLPNVVCEECRDQLDSCYRFRRMARKSQKSLRNFVEYAEKLNGSPQVS